MIAPIVTLTALLLIAGVAANRAASRSKCDDTRVGSHVIAEAVTSRRSSDAGHRGGLQSPRPSRGVSDVDPPQSRPRRVDPARTGGLGRRLRLLGSPAGLLLPSQLRPDHRG